MASAREEGFGGGREGVEVAAFFEDANGAKIVEQGLDGKRITTAGLRDLFRAGWIRCERREDVEGQREANPLRLEDAPKEVADEIGVGVHFSINAGRAQSVDRVPRQIDQTARGYTDALHAYLWDADSQTSSSALRIGQSTERQNGHRCP